MYKYYLEGVMCTNPVGLSLVVIHWLAHQMKNEIVFFRAMDGGQVGSWNRTLTRYLRGIHCEAHPLFNLSIPEHQFYKKLMQTSSPNTSLELFKSL